MTSIDSDDKPSGFSPAPKQSWWARQSRTRKILFILLFLLLLLALALGLGLGLGLGGKGGEEEEPPTEPPLPPLTGTVWQPPANTTWQIVLKQELDLSRGVKALTPPVEVYDIDLFINSKQTIDTLHKAGKKVICYFSAGSYEDWRPDRSQFQRSYYGKGLDGWSGEWWLDLRNSEVMNIMKRRIDMAAEKGCDAIDPDNVDAYQNDNGLGLTAKDSVNFIGQLATYAASKNMSTGLKNAGDIVPQVLNVTHFSVNEQCAEYKECEKFLPYIKANKPVFHIEYPKSGPKISSNQQKQYCDEGGDGVSSESMGLFSTVLKNMNLDGYVRYCNGATGSTPVVYNGDTDGDD